jgi:hypothetical protein
VNALIWRLHHRQVYFALGALVVLGVLFAITGVVMANDYHRFMAECGTLQICGDAGSRLFRGDGAIIDVVDATILVPLLFGLFWGAPLVAKEFEDGTQNLAWTQGVSRTRWLTSNVAWVFAAAALWAGAMTLLVSWWRTPENALDTRFAAFDIQGIAPIAYALFAVALGIAVGSVLRRVLPAIAVTLGLYAVARAVIALYLRPHFVTPVTKTFAMTARGSPWPAGAWSISSGIVGPDGTFYSGGIDLRAMPAACRAVLADGPRSVAPCMTAHGYHQLSSYQPAGRFWAFQGIEAAIFVVLAAGLVALAYRMVLRRDA